MIQNFNFYDVYGYLLPGLIFLGLLWLPFGLTEEHWPEAALSSALVAVVFGYITGHILQALGRNAWPPMIKDFDGVKRYPSDVLLDSDDNTLSAALKSQLADRIKTFFSIDVKVELAGKAVEELERASKEDKSIPSLRGERRDAFYLCRDALIKVKAISYAEQMQGMYALMMGLMVTFVLGASYHFGWALSGWKKESLQLACQIIIFVGLALAVLLLMVVLRAGDSEKLKRNLWLGVIANVLLALLASGYLEGIEKVKDWNQRGQFMAITLVSIFFVLICLTGKRYFAQEYASAIYRAFSTYEKPA